MGTKWIESNCRKVSSVAGKRKQYRFTEKALDTGEISLLDYIVEIGLYYTTVNQALEAERDYQKAIAELSAVEL